MPTHAGGRVTEGPERGTARGGARGGALHRGPKSRQPPGFETRGTWIVLATSYQKISNHSKAIQPVYPKGDQSWVFIGRTDAEAEAPTLWSPDGKN